MVLPIATGLAIAGGLGAASSLFGGKKNQPQIAQTWQNSTQKQSDSLPSWQLPYVQQGMARAGGLVGNNRCWYNRSGSTL